MINHLKQLYKAFYSKTGNNFKVTGTPLKSFLAHALKLLESDIVHPFLFEKNESNEKVGAATVD